MLSNTLLKHTDGFHSQDTKDLTLSENDVALNQLTRVVDADIFNKKYFEKLTLEFKGVIRFQ